MKSLFRPIFALALALPLLLAACGDKEPEQRAAFTQFLQTRIIDKPGVRVPQLTAEEKVLRRLRRALRRDHGFQLGHGCIGQAAEQPDAKAACVH